MKIILALIFLFFIIVVILLSMSFFVYPDRASYQPHQQNVGGNKGDSSKGTGIDIKPLDGESSHDESSYESSHDEDTEMREAMSGTTAPSATLPECPKEFSSSPAEKFCYKIITEKYTRSGASDACKKLHTSAGLVVIRNKKEQGVLREAINSLSSTDSAGCSDGGGLTMFYTSGQRRALEKKDSPYVWKPGGDLPETEVVDASLDWAREYSGVIQPDCIVIWFEKNSNVDYRGCDLESCSVCQVVI
jgi:hypothetical protein